MGDIVRGDVSWSDLTDFDLLLDLILVLGGILAIFSFSVLMCVHRKCLSSTKYKRTMSEIKDYILGFELQNKYTMVKWTVIHTVDSTQFNIIVTPLYRENQQMGAGYSDGLDVK